MIFIHGIHIVLQPPQGKHCNWTLVLWTQQCEQQNWIFTCYKIQKFHHRQIFDLKEKLNLHQAGQNSCAAHLYQHKVFLFELRSYWDIIIGFCCLASSLLFNEFFSHFQSYHYDKWQTHSYLQLSGRLGLFKLFVDL